MALEFYNTTVRTSTIKVGTNLRMNTELKIAVVLFTSKKLKFKLNTLCLGIL